MTGDVPDFAETINPERFAVERSPRDGADGDRVDVVDRMGNPAKGTLLRLIQAANDDGWRLDEHTDAGDELAFVPIAGRE